ncbi:MAG: hydroxyacylglutathione hydrolase [Verrucomicrobiota bacterium]|jgi:glyoxylase-like metal-dependent hydrolase (beta-lactamase superfamily II)
MIPLEDNLADIIGKAQRGLGLSDTQLAEKARVNSQTVRKLREGEFDELTVLRIAPVLGLAGRALCELAHGAWRPKPVDNIDGLAQFTTRYGDVAVNSYLVWDPATKHAAAFDTGADCTAMLKRATKENLAIKLILLTHAHVDHIAALGELKEKTSAPAFIPEREKIPEAEPIDEGKHFSLGKIDIDTRLTWGHSHGGMTYVVNGLARKVAMVGDSIFAGSMGGGSVSYRDAVRNNLEKILTLPDDTIICPGHGPMTTVGEEKQHNPFFAGQTA